METEREPQEKLNEHRLRSLTIRLEEETYKKLIAIAGEKSKAEYIRAVLVAHLSAPQEHRESTTTEPQRILETKIKSLEDLLEAKDQTIRILEEDKGFVTLEYAETKAKLNNLLMPSKEEIHNKAWWKFWKS